MAMLEIRNVQKTFRTYAKPGLFHRPGARKVISELPVLRGVDLTVEKGDAFCRPSLCVGSWCNCGKYAACSIAWSVFFRRACTYIYHEKSGKFKYHKITFSGNGNEYFFYGTHFGSGAFVEPVTDGWILGIRWISRGNVAGCKNYFSGRDTGIFSSSVPCTEN